MQLIQVLFPKYYRFLSVLALIMWRIIKKNDNFPFNSPVCYEIIQLQSIPIQKEET